MKKLIGLCFLLSWIFTATAKPVDDLQAQLANWHGFSAEFEQTVTGADGKTLQNASGTMQLQRPGRFKWHTQQPDEQWVVADGKNLWTYDPFVEQVTVYDQQKALANTPFLLLASAHQSDWANYLVSEQQEGVYRIAPINNKDANFQWFELAVQHGELVQLRLRDAQGQLSEFRFEDFKLNPEFKKGTFKFDVPDGADVDDQRNGEQ